MWYRGKHRKGSRAQGWRLALAPWLVISITATVLVSGGAVGYAWLLHSSCDGKPTTVTIAASPDQYSVLEELGQQWQRTQPSIKGRCGEVAVVQADSPDVISALDDTWTHGAQTRPATELARPDVWVPDSSTWVRLAAQRPNASTALPDDDAPLSSLASSPVVLTTAAPMAQALGAIDQPLDAAALDDWLTNAASWEKRGHPEWGTLQLGLTDPRRATASLHMLLALADNPPGARNGTAGQLEWALSMAQRATGYRAQTDSYLRDMAAIADPAALANTPVFPALERDVAMHNATSSAVPLSAKYLTQHPAAADYPYVVLDAPWVSDEKKDVAAAFLTYLESDDARTAFRAAAFRDPSGVVDEAEGVTPPDFAAKLKPTEGSILTGNEVARVLEAWSAAHGSAADQSIAEGKTRG